jgi:magnesium chelatase subunit D
VLVLPHRRRRKPFEQPELPSERLDQICADLQQPETNESETSGEDSGPPETQTIAPTSFPDARPIEIDPETRQPHVGHGRRNSVATREQGHYVRAVQDPQARDLAVDATVRAAVRRGGHRDGKLEVAPEDLHRKERSGRTGTLILFVVDASGSMAAQQRMAAVKGAVLSLLRSAYEQRDRVGVIAFRGPRAEVLLPPTGSVELAERALRELPTGGRTPLAHALVLAHDLLRRERQAHPELCPLLVLFSDGRANICVPDVAGDAWLQTLQAATDITALSVPALVLDTETTFVRMGRAQELATALGGECLALEELSAAELTLTLRERTERVRGARRW